jgi:hypothetical protein
VIYAAASRALCALEVLANANELGGDYVVTPIEVPDDIGAITLSLGPTFAFLNAKKSIVRGTTQ